MSWLFSRALVEAFSEASSLDGEPCAPLNVMPTPHKFSRNDKMMDSSSLSRFGLTCAILTEDRGEELLTSFLAGFPARTSAAPAREPGSMESIPGFGASLPGSFARLDPSGSGWKTPLSSLFEGLDEFSGTWPRWGSMRNGVCWERMTSVSTISENGSGFWPTPNAGDHKAGMSNSPNRQQSSLPRTVGIVEGVSEPGRSGGLNPTFPEWLMGWPINWTALKPLETAKYPSAMPQRSKSSIVA